MNYIQCNSIKRDIYFTSTEAKVLLSLLSIDEELTNLDEKK